MSTATTMSNYESLSLILAALAAFFTLITGATAIFATWGVIHFKKLKKEREAEIKKVGELQDELEGKISEAEKLKDGGKMEIEEIKKDYQNLRNKFFNLAAPSVWYASGGRGGSSVTVAQLQAQVNALLTQLATLQGGYSESEPTQKEIDAAGERYIQSEIDRKRGK